jgi:hypothetical protein
MSGASRARSLVCEWKKHTSKSPQVQPLSPAFPARWFTTYSVLTPVRPGFVVTVATRKSRGLAPASGRQDHTTSPSANNAARLATPSASTASRLAFVTTRPPLILSRDGADHDTGSEKTKEKFWSKWAGPSYRLELLAKLGFWRALAVEAGSP